MPRISEPGVYDMPAEEYHADPVVEPSLSSSIVRVLLNETAQHAFTAHPRLNPNFERDEEDKFDIGNASHSLILGDPKIFALCDEDSWRSKAAQEIKARARATGKIPMLTKHWDRVVEMTDSARRQLEMHRDASDAFTNGKPEQTLIWFEDIEGQRIWFRCRLDWKPNDLTRAFDDFKSTACADPDGWAKIAFNVGHDIQASFHRRGIRKVLGVRNPEMRLIVQETKDPFALCAMKFSNDALELADRRLDQGVRKWAWCRKNNAWPGYPAMTCTIGPPPWHETQMMAREERDKELMDRHEADDVLALGLEFHKPL